MTSTPENRLRDRMVIEKGLFAREVSRHRLESVNRFNQWAESGRRDQALLEKFFENYYRAQELDDRIAWIDALLATYE